jgi:hypothetical protein
LLPEYKKQEKNENQNNVEPKNHLPNELQSLGDKNLA